MLHSNGHLLNVNSVVLERAGITAGTNVEGIVKGPDGQPTGELAEMAAKYMAYRVAGNPFNVGMTVPALRRFGAAACFAGVTTATDLHNPLDDATVEAYRTGTAAADFSAAAVAGVLRRVGLGGGGDRQDQAIGRRQHRQAALWPGQGDDGWLDPGLHRPAEMARLLQRQAERRLERAAGPAGRAGARLS